jgi:hypothetical protein
MLLERDDDGDDEEEDGIDEAELLELGLLELLELELLLELLEDDDDELELGMLGILDCDDCEELVDSQPASTSASALRPSNCLTTGIFIMDSPDSLIKQSSMLRFQQPDQTGPAQDLSTRNISSSHT